MHLTARTEIGDTNGAQQCPTHPYRGSLTPPGVPTPYLGLDVLLGGGHQAGTAEPQHHHDGEEEAGGQDPARKARAPVAPHNPPPKRGHEFMAGHGNWGRGGVRICSATSSRSHSTYLDMQPRKSCSCCGGSGGCALALPRSFTGGLSPFARGPGRGEAMLNLGTHVGTPSPLPPQHVMGVPISPRDPLPAKGAQRIPAGPHPEPPQRAWGCGKLIRHEKKEICSALQNSDGSQEGSEAPSPIPAARTPPHLCGAGGCQGWIPIPIPAVLVGSPEPRVLDIPSQAGTGWAGKKGDSEEGGPHHSGHPQRGSWRHPHLEHHDFAIVCLQVEGPGGGDEALGRADDVVAEGGDQIQHGKGRRLQLQALQRSGDITSALSPRHPPRQDTSHPEVTAGLSRVLGSGLNLLLPGMQSDVPGSNPTPGGSPREGCDPCGDHPALGSSPSPRSVPLGLGSPSCGRDNGSGAAAMPRAFLSWQPLGALDSWPSRQFVIFKASLLESAWLLPATGSEHFPTAPCTVKPANRK